MPKEENKSLELVTIGGTLMLQQAAEEIFSCNKDTAAYGLALSAQQAIALAETRMNSLKKTGRIEFGGTVPQKLIAAFCDSPYISQLNYEETLHELIDLFYEFKNDTLDVITDNELIEFMKKAYNEGCHGSLELLSGRELTQLARHIHEKHSFNSFQLQKEGGLDGQA